MLATSGLSYLAVDIGYCAVPPGSLFGYITLDPFRIARLTSLPSASAWRRHGYVEPDTGGIAWQVISEKEDG